MHKIVTPFWDSNVLCVALFFKSPTDNCVSEHVLIQPFGVLLHAVERSIKKRCNQFAQTLKRNLPTAFVVNFKSFCWRICDYLWLAKR